MNKMGCISSLVFSKSMLRPTRGSIVITPCSVNPKNTNLILEIRLGLGLDLGLGVLINPQINSFFKRCERE